MEENNALCPFFSHSCCSSNLRPVSLLLLVNDERRHRAVHKLDWVGRTKYLNMSELSAKRFEVGEGNFLLEPLESQENVERQLKCFWGMQIVNIIFKFFSNSNCSFCGELLYSTEGTLWAASLGTFIETSLFSGH